MALQIGASVFYQHMEDPGKGVWSAKLGRRDATNVYITFDGIQVPESHACGIQGPDPTKNWLLVPYGQLTIRQSQKSDLADEFKWETLVDQYKTKSGYYEAAKKRFASATPGMSVLAHTNVLSWQDWMPPPSVQIHKGTLVSLHFDVKPGYAMIDTKTKDGVIQVKLEDVFLV
jgi:hypothetical protein